jgi:hypothetical protein
MLTLHLRYALIELFKVLLVYFEIIPMDLISIFVFHLPIVAVELLELGKVLRLILFLLPAICIKILLKTRFFGDFMLGLYHSWVE